MNTPTVAVPKGPAGRVSAPVESGGGASLSAVGVHPSPYLSIAELAPYLRVSIHTVRKWQKKGRLPVPFKPAGKLLWRKDEIDYWVETSRKLLLDEAVIRARIGLVSVPVRKV